MLRHLVHPHKMLVPSEHQDLDLLVVVLQRPGTRHSSLNMSEKVARPEQLREELTVQQSPWMYLKLAKMKVSSKMKIWPSELALPRPIAQEEVAEMQNVLCCPAPLVSSL